MNFTICLIAKNESETLPRLLESLKEFKEKGGEVLLLDTGSTDGTPDVARGLGCSVTEVGDQFITTIDAETADKINKQFVVEGEAPLIKDGDKLFDFASARNYIANLATTDMIAMPDCDEVYDTFNLESIQRIIDEGIDQLSYNFVYSFDKYGNEAIKFQHSKFYNRTKMKWVGIVHEVLMPMTEAEVKTITVDEPVIKLEHYQNEKTDRSNYLVGLAYDCFLNPDNDRNSHYLGRELVWNNHPKSGIKELERHIRMGGWDAERSKSMLLIAKAWMDLNFEGTALDWMFRAFIACSRRREPLLALAEHFYYKKDAQKAACFANACLEITEDLTYWDDKSRNEVLPHEILYWAQWHLGDKMGSRFHFQRAIALQPNNPKYQEDAQFYPDDTYGMDTSTEK